MKQTVLAFSMLLILLLYVACCATKPKEVETVIDEAVTDETIIAENVVAADIIAEQNPEGPFEPADFLRNLTGMEVVDIFPDPNMEHWVMLPGKTVSGRQYFEYKSSLYPKPISSADEMFAMFNHQAMIARQFNPGYVVNLAMNVSNAESEELEQKTLTFKVQPGIAFHDYRREGTLKYTVRDVDGKLRYGEYAVISAVVTQNEAEAEAYSALQEWLEQAETTDISDLFVKLFAKKTAEKSKGVDYE